MKLKKSVKLALASCGAALGFGWTQAWSATNVYLTEVPDYSWWAGCFGTASGNLMAFWDRHGFPDFYTGPTGGGLAPLNDASANSGIVSLWASQAGVDGRPQYEYGHYDDYYLAYEFADPDPYVLAGRPEHSPDCIGDFIGLSQWKWTNLDGACDGNLDGFCFNYWDASGKKRVNYMPSLKAGWPPIDLQSGLRAWTQYRGSDCTVFTQMADFNPRTPAGEGFTFNELKAEIDTGYPVLLFLQKYDETSRPIGGHTRANPELHGMLAYGYYIDNFGTPFVRYRTSWASGDNRMRPWSAEPWEAELPLWGVIGFHPAPKIKQFSLEQGNLTLHWEGPASELYDSAQGGKRKVHGYVVEMASSLDKKDFAPASPVLTDQVFTVVNCPTPAYFRLQLVYR